MTTTARRRRIQTSPFSRPMADVSAMVWFPWPEDWPLPTPEQMAADARKRAAFYSRSPFWSDGVLGRRKLPVPKPAVLKQRELF